MSTTVGINWNDPTTRRFITGSVARPNPGDDRPRCFYVDDEARDEHGIIALLVFGDEPGYTPMLGSNPPESTWYWGPDLEAAERVCDLVNLELFGLDRESALEIVGASIAQAGADR